MADAGNTSERENSRNAGIRPGRWIFRGVIAVFLLAAVVYGTRIYQYHRAVNAIQHAHGWVYSSYKSSWLDALELRRAELFLAEAIGIQFSRPVPGPSMPSVSITIHIDPIVNAELKQLIPHLRKLHNLRELSISDSQIDNEGLSYLSEFAELLSLNISRTRITDSSLEHSRELTKLEALEQFTFSRGRISIVKESICQVVTCNLLQGVFVGVDIRLGTRPVRTL